jgi:hypothetical protein
LTPLGTQEDGYKVYSGGLHLVHHFGSEVDFLISSSETSLRSHSAASSNFDGITYDSSLIYRIGPRFQTTLAFSRKVNPSNRLDPNFSIQSNSFLDASYSIAQTYQAEADYHITSRFLVGFGASDTKSAFKGAALVPGFDLAKESVKSFFGSLGFNITPELSVHLTANQDQRHADVIGYSYASTRFGLSISQAF